MRRRALVLAIAMLRSVVAWPQASLTTLEVRVTRLDVPVPGATVTLSGSGLEQTGVTSGEGRVVFPQLAGGTYRLSAAASDMQTGPHVVEVRPGPLQEIVLSVGRGEGVRETDRPSLDPTVVFSRDDLQGLPRPADPWSVLRDVPGIVQDRVNVGGSETAQQALVVSHGDPGTGAAWTLDGLDVTDPAALGFMGLYPDLDGLDAVQVTTQAADVRARTPGVQVGLRVRDPRLRATGAAHLRGGGGFLQSDNLPDVLRGRPFFRNRTDHVVEAGAELGGPIDGGRLWLWGSASRTALRQDTFTEHAEDLGVSCFTGKGRLRLGTGSLTLLAVRSEKIDEGRDAVLVADPESRWRQSGPTHLVGLEHQQTIGGVSLLSRAAYLDAGFRLDPPGGPDASYFEDYRGVSHGSYATFETDRPRIQAGAEATTRRSGLGFDHALLAGTSYRRSVVTTRQAWPGNQVLAFERQTVFFRTFQLTGFALPTRAQNARSVQDQLEGYVQDEARRGRLGLTLGLRLDRLSGRNLDSSVGANPVFPDLLPAVAFPGETTRLRWLDLLPRARVSFDLAADGSTAVAVGYAAYGAPMGAGDVVFDNPVGREGASLTYYWRDRNGDHVVQRGELDTLRGRLGSSGLDPDDPASVVSPHRIDPDLRAPRTHEVSGTFAQRLGALNVRAAASWRALLRPLWRPLRGLALSDYIARGAVQGRLFEEDYGITFFAPATQSRIVPGNGRLLTNREGYRQDTLSFEIGVSGRFGGVLAFDAWGGLSDWRERFTDTSRSIQDPTPLDTEPLQDRGAVAVRATGLGRADLFVNARWTAGASVRVRLPLALDAAALFHARQGFPIPYFQIGNTGDPTAAAKNVLVAAHLDAYRLPSLAVLDARLARGFRAGRGMLTASVDLFNVLDASTTLQVARDVELPGFDRPREILRPRLLRLGLEYRF